MYSAFSYFTLEKASRIQNASSSNQTQIIDASACPRWDFSKKVKISTLRQKITFKVKSENTIAFDYLIGACEVDLAILADNPTFHGWLTLIDDKKRNKGELHVAITFDYKPQTPTKGLR
eukprot:TRINITY_DN21484_c0_g1_i1.p1 TRINITY_DN21484_c0_g1~~TRINITY_DN21484_c0_g1_i1.p1  ORF type:complete len:119 (+),score=19.12 TRINITY_DN21484_c0_g1_i1:181-537(+)